MSDNNSDSTDLSFSILQKEYESEESRNKHLETKSQIMLALCGIIISANMILLKSIFDQNYFLKTKLVLISIELFLIAYAMYELLSVFKIRLFKKINHIALASDSVQELNEKELKKKVIYDYNECINESFYILGQKSKAVRYGVNLIEFSIFLFCIIIFLVVISTYTERGKLMSEKQNTTQTTTNSSTNCTEIVFT